MKDAVDQIASDVKTRLRTFAAKFAGNRPVGDDEDLVEKGLVTSLFAMQLVLFLEKEFAVTIDNADLDLDNFRSIDALARLLERKTHTAGPA